MHKRYCMRTVIDASLSFQILILGEVIVPENLTLEEENQFAIKSSMNLNGNNVELDDITIMINDTKVSNDGSKVNVRVDYCDVSFDP